MNARKHADADSVIVRLKLEPAEAELSIRDDGKGFVLEEVPEGRFGLVGMNERVRLMGGTLEIQSALGEGTRILVRVPLDRPVPDPQPPLPGASRSAGRALH